VRGGRRAREGARKKERERGRGREREKREIKITKNRNQTHGDEISPMFDPMRVKVSSLPSGVRVMVRFAYIPEPLGGPMHHIINHKTRVVPLKWR